VCRPAPTSQVSTDGLAGSLWDGQAAGLLGNDQTPPEVTCGVRIGSGRSLLGGDDPDMPDRERLLEATDLNGAAELALTPSISDSMPRHRVRPARSATA
jgi:hypothetical protein